MVVKRHPTEKTHKDAPKPKDTPRTHKDSPRMPQKRPEDTPRGVIKRRPTEKTQKDTLKPKDTPRMPQRRPEDAPKIFHTNARDAPSQGCNVGYSKVL